MKHFNLPFLFPNRSIQLYQKWAKSIFPHLHDGARKVAKEYGAWDALKRLKEYFKGRTVSE